MYKHLLILLLALNNILANPSTFSEIVILTSANVHGETEPCG